MSASTTPSMRCRHQEENWPLRGNACVVEPDHGQRASIVSLLRHMGFPTYEALSGSIGGLIAVQIPLAVIVVNVMIKDVQPLKLIQHMRARAPAALIIGLTSQPRAQALSRVAGADAVLAWPPCGEALCATITEALELAHPFAPGPCSPTFEAGALASR